MAEEMASAGVEDGAALMLGTPEQERRWARGECVPAPEPKIPVMLTRETIENMLYGGGKPEDHTILTRAFRDALNASEHCVGDNPNQEED